MNIKKTICIVPLILLTISLQAQKKQVSGASELRNTVTYLASDELVGRYPGTHGDTLAANFIVSHFEKSGIKPWGNPSSTDKKKKYFQDFDLPLSQKVEGDNHLMIGTNSLKLNTDYRPLNYSGNGSVKGEIIYLGFGLQSNDKSFPWNDYRNADVKGKCVLILRGLPDNKKIQKQMAHLSSDRSKALLAQDMGATAVMFISQASDSVDAFGSLTERDFALKIPVVQIKRNMAEKIFGSDALNDRESGMGAMAAMGGAMGNMQTGDSPKIQNNQTDLQVNLVRVYVKTHNIVGYLEGSNPALRNEYIIIGAHYDHLGMGGEHSGSRRPDTLAIHHGADDNASGVATMLHLARQLKSVRPERSVLFVAFSAEEEGVIGSKQFADKLPVKTESVSAMFNFDMVGSLRNSALTVGGSGTSTESDSLIHVAAKGSGLHVTCSPEGYGPSDHASFYAKQIPVFYFTTGGTLTYHTPDDQASTLNYAGMDSVANYAQKLISLVANRPNKLTYHEAGAPNAEPMRAQFKVTLGLMPDITGGDNKGLRADIVVKGKPAYEAGLRSGDVITDINGKSVSNIEDYMARLSELKPGENVNVKVRRGTEIINFVVHLTNPNK